MSELNRHQPENVVVDYAQGLITRREALHRLALVGISVAVAAPLLAACDARSGGSVAAPLAGAQAEPSFAPTTPITFPGPEGRELQGVWSAATTPRGTVLVVHDITGLTGHIGAVAGRLAASGFSALAVDLLSAEGGSAKFRDPDQSTVSVTMPQLGEGDTEGTVTSWLKEEGDRVEADEPLLSVSTAKVDTELPSPAAGILSRIVVGDGETAAVGAELGVIAVSGDSAATALQAAPPQRHLADVKAGIGELLRREPERQPGALGFGFGGGVVWSLLAAGEPRLHAAAPCYGPFPQQADLLGSPNAAVLGVYAQLDTQVNASREAAREALVQAGTTHEIVTYPNVHHGFFNEAGARYDANRANQAYEKLVSWFDRHLG